MKVKRKRCTEESETYLGKSKRPPRVGMGFSKTGQAALLAICTFLVTLKLHLRRFLKTTPPHHQRYVSWLGVAFNELIILEGKSEASRVVPGPSICPFPVNGFSGDVTRNYSFMARQREMPKDFVNCTRILALLLAKTPSSCFSCPPNFSCLVWYSRLFRGDHPRSPSS